MRVPKRAVRRSSFQLQSLAVRSCCLVMRQRCAARRKVNSTCTDIGKLPLAYQGRVKPFDTLARNSLVIISEKQTYKDASGKRRPAIEWLLDVVSGVPQARQHKVFRIENLEVLDTLGLQRRAGFRYSADEISKNSAELAKQMRLASSREQGGINALSAEGPRTRNEDQVVPAPGGSRSSRCRSARITRWKTFPRRYSMRKPWREYQPPLAVPLPNSAEQPWESFTAAWAEMHAARLHGERPNRGGPAAEQYVRQLSDLSRRRQQRQRTQSRQFNRDLAHYQDYLAANPPAQFNPRKVAVEAWFNHSDPFFWCIMLLPLGVRPRRARLAWDGVARSTAPRSGSSLSP